MNTRELKLLREAIRLIGPDGDYEEGMLILYRLARMNNAAKFIEDVRKAPSVDIKDIKPRDSFGD